MIPIPGRTLQMEAKSFATSLLSSYEGSPSVYLLFLLDMVFSQLDAYNSGRSLQHLHPWMSVCLAQTATSHADGLYVTRLHLCSLRGCPRRDPVHRKSASPAIQRSGWYS